MQKKLGIFFTVLFLFCVLFPFTLQSVQAAGLAAPKNLKASSIKETSFKLSWSSVSGAKKYDIYRYSSSKKTFQKIAASTSAGFTCKGLSGGKTYRYKVKAVNAKKTSGFSQELRVLTKPSAPKGISVKATHSTLTIKWTKTTGAKKYKIYVATSKSGSYSLAATTTTNSCELGKLKSGKTYYIKISASNASGEGVKSAIFSAKTKIAPKVFLGTGDDSISVNLGTEFSTAKITHKGARNLIVWDYLKKKRDLLVNKIGNYTGTVLMQGAGTHDLNIMADGDWRIEIKPIQSTGAVSFSGKGDYVTPAFTMPSNKKWKFTHDGSGNFIVIAVSSTGKDYVVNKIGAYSGKQIVDIKTKEAAFFQVIADGKWSIEKQ